MRVLSSPFVLQLYADTMRANQLLKHNIDTLLIARGQNRKDLALWCYRTESWISHIFKSDKREIPIKYFDRISDFFGIATYQLLQPGISPLTERRRRERRRGIERRIGHVQRVMLDAGAEVNRARSERIDHEADKRKATLPPEKLRAAVAELERQISEFVEQTEPGRQAARPRAHKPKTRAGGRNAGRPNADEGEP